MALAVTIDGVDRTAHIDASIVMRRAVSAVGTITFTAIDDTGAWAPAQFEDISVALTGHPTRVGTIAVPPRVGYLQRVEGASTVNWATTAEVTAHDAMARAGRTMRNGIDVGPITMKAALQALVTDNLSTLGVSLAVGQATGPTFDTLAWPWMYGTEVLDALCAAAAAATGKTWVWRIDDSFVLEAWEVGAKAAPQTIAAADVIEIIPTVGVPPFRNDQWLIYGPAEIRDVTESWVGDGATRAFPVRYQCSVSPGGLYVNGDFEPVGTYGVDTGMEWTWDAALTNANYGTAGGFRQLASFAVLTGAETLTAPHPSQFPNVVHVQDGTSVGDVGIYVRKDTDATIVDVDQAIARATAIMAASVAAAQRRSVRTLVHGCDPGEVVTLSVGISALNGDYLIERATDTYLVRAGEDPQVEHVLDLVKGDIRTDTADGFIRAVLSGASGGGGAVVAASVGSGSTTVIAGAVEGNLGGSRDAGVNHTTWTPTREHREWRCQADGTYTAYVEAWTLNAATSVQPRIYDLTGSVSVSGTSTTSTTSAKQQIVFAGLAGHDYRLELLAGNTTHPVFGLGKVLA